MEQRQACIDKSTKFLCPICGRSAFEVVGTQWGHGEEDDTGEYLVMRCLQCIELFCYQLGTEDPCEVSAECSNHMLSGTDILGPIPDTSLDTTQ